MTTNTWYPLGRFSAAQIQLALGESERPHWEVHDVDEDRFMITSDLSQFNLDDALWASEQDVRNLDVGETLSVGGGASPLYFFYRVR